MKNIMMSRFKLVKRIFTMEESDNGFKWFSTDYYTYFAAKRACLISNMPYARVIANLDYFSDGRVVFKIRNFGGREKEHVCKMRINRGEMMGDLTMYCDYCGQECEPRYRRVTLIEDVWFCSKKCACKYMGLCKQNRCKTCGKELEENVYTDLVGDTFCSESCVFEDWHVFDVKSNE